MKKTFSRVGTIAAMVATMTAAPMLSVGVSSANAGDRTATTFKCCRGTNPPRRAVGRFEDHGEHVYLTDVRGDSMPVYAEVWDATTSDFKGALRAGPGAEAHGNYSIKEGHRVRINVWLNERDNPGEKDKYLGFVKRADGKLPRA